MNISKSMLLSMPAPFDCLNSAAAKCVYKIAVNKTIFKFAREKKNLLLLIEFFRNLFFFPIQFTATFSTQTICCCYNHCSTLWVPSKVIKASQSPAYARLNVK